MSPSRIRRILSPAIVLFFVAGFGLGCTGAWFAGGYIPLRNLSGGSDFFEEGLLSFPASTALRAYDHAMPKVALWAFHDYIALRETILEEKPHLSESEFDDFVYFYAIISILAARVGDEELSRSAMDAALRRAKESGIPQMEKLNTPDSILAMTARLDDYRRRLTQDGLTTDSLSSH